MQQIICASTLKLIQLRQAYSPGVVGGVKSRKITNPQPDNKNVLQMRGQKALSILFVALSDIKTINV